VLCLCGAVSSLCGEKMNPKRYTINLGKQQFRKSIRRHLTESIIKQYTTLEEIEGPRVHSKLTVRGTEFQINYDTRYLVSFMYILFIS